MYQEQEIAQYDFHPKLCKKSELIMMEKSGIQELLSDEKSPPPGTNQVSQIGDRKGNKFNELYADARQRQDR